MTPNLGQHGIRALPEFLRFGRLDFAITVGSVVTFWDLDFAVMRGFINMR